MAVVLTVGALVAAFVGFAGFPIYNRAVTLGITRSSFDNIHGYGLKLLPETVACEDLHYESHSNQLYTSCQVDNVKRSAWFPPLLQFDESASTAEGTIVVIDVATQKPKTLKYTNFASPLIPHGIEIYTDPQDPTSTVIFVVNHLANPGYFASPRTSKVKGLEHIEVFKHVHGEDTVEHIRTVYHPLIKTANDIAAQGPNAFYVTNDHHYLEGAMRMVEEVGTRSIAPWSNTIFVEFDPDVQEPSAGVKAHVALTGLHNNNGLSHGRPDYPEILVIDASAGVLNRAKNHVEKHTLEVLESIQMPITLDNPFYYHDQYATPGNNASGYIISGLAHAVKLADDFPDPKKPLPISVYHVRSNDHKIDFHSSKNTWEKRLVLQDDGKTLRSASGAVLTGIDPKETAGKKQGWLWVTGFGSEALIVAKIDL
ncbi:hypothetical protein AMS68_001173 [Peltaster fructicola]|uniref:Serum paraoxonase/arylesterase family protein n=1 Tax=Peltaster fructicola TaxID=286661 RepID=A0A6H0XLS3_9PEZI|nr:hypothetical protein AMS68_001173 [Peltaster fructicola]